MLLSASVEYEDYLRQVDVACRSGASEVAASRAVWKEASSLPQQKRLGGTAAACMQRLSELCDAIGCPHL